MEHRQSSIRLHDISGTVAFYRGEREPLEKERLGMVKNFGPGALFLATSEKPAAGTVLHLRVYNQAAPPGQAELSLRGIVQQHLPHIPHGVGLWLPDAKELGDPKLRSLLATLGPALRPAYAQS